MRVYSAATILWIMVATATRMVAVHGKGNNKKKGSYLYNNAPETKPIVEVTAKDMIFEVAPSVKPRVVLFYSPTCDVCIRYKKKYIALALAIRETFGPHIGIYAVSCDDQPTLCKRYKVDNYPTLRLTLDNGKTWSKLSKHEQTTTLRELSERLDKEQEQEDKAAAGGDDDDDENENQLDGEGEEEDEEGEGEEDAAEAEEEEPVQTSKALRKKKPFSALSSRNAVPKRKMLAEEEAEEEEDIGEFRDEDGGEEEEEEDGGEDGNEGDDEEGEGEEELEGEAGMEEEEAEDEGVEPEGEVDEGEEEDDVDVEEAEEEEGEGGGDEEEEEEGEEEKEEGEEEEGLDDEDEDVEGDDGEEEEEESEDKAEMGDDEEESPDGSGDKADFPRFPEVQPGAAKARLAGKLIDQDLAAGLREKYLSHLKKKRGFNVFGRRSVDAHKPTFRHRHKLDKLVPREGATDTMEAHKPFTSKYKERQAQILSSIERKKGKHVRQKIEEHWRNVEQSKGTLRLPFKKEVKKQRLVERIPLVKHVVAEIPPEEELMLDTSLSFMHGMKYGVFKHNGPLTFHQKRALSDWLHLLSMTLPEEWGIHDTIDDLLENINYVAKGESYLHTVLNRHKLARKRWSRSCQKPGQEANFPGFTCGLWKLLHTSSIGLAQHRGGQTLIESGMRKPSSRKFSPAHAADVVRDYIQHFFLCEVCSKNFLATYQDCSRNRRCDRLAKDISSATDADWKEMAKWMWEVHNDVSVRLVKERAQFKRAGLSLSTKQASMASSSIAALWPNLDSCLKCFGEDGSWDEEAVFLFLELEYWPDQSDVKTNRLLEFDEDMLGGSAGEVGLFWILVILGLVLVYILQQHRVALQKTILSVRMQASGSSSLATTKRAE